MQDKIDFIQEVRILMSNTRGNLNMDSIKDEQERQIMGAFLFGIINGLAYEMKEDPAKVQASMVDILITDLKYSSNQSVDFCQYLIDCTDQETNPTIFSIIHRGMNGYYQLKEEKYDEFKGNYQEIIQLVKEASNE